MPSALPLRTALGSQLFGIAYPLTSTEGQLKLWNRMWLGIWLKGNGEISSVAESGIGQIKTASSGLLAVFDLSFGKDLLDVDLSANFCDLSFDLLGFVFADGLLDCLWSAVDEILGFFEAKTGDLSNDLDDVELGIAS